MVYFPLSLKIKNHRLYCEMKNVQVIDFSECLVLFYFLNFCGYTLCSFGHIVDFIYHFARNKINYKRLVPSLLSYFFLKSTLHTENVTVEQAKNDC